MLRECHCVTRSLDPEAGWAVSQLPVIWQRPADSETSKEQTLAVLFLTEFYLFS